MITITNTALHTSFVNANKHTHAKRMRIKEAQDYCFHNFDTKRESNKIALKY